MKYIIEFEYYYDCPEEAGKYIQVRVESDLPKDIILDKFRKHHGDDVVNAEIYTLDEYWVSHDVFKA